MILPNYSAGARPAFTRVRCIPEFRASSEKWLDFGFKDIRVLESNDLLPKYSLPVVEQGGG